MRKKCETLSIGGLIAIFLAISMVLTPIQMTLADSVTAPLPETGEEITVPNGHGTIPGKGGVYLIEPYLVIDKFNTGECQIVTSQHQKKLEQGIKALNDNPDDFFIAIGTVSNLKITGTCHYSPDYLNYSIGKTCEGCTLSQKGNEPCQKVLALSRVHNVRKWYIDHGVTSQRFLILNFPALTMRAGGNLPNQSVVIWRVSTKIIRPEVGEGHQNIIEIIGYQGQPLQTHLRLFLEEDLYYRSDTEMDEENGVIYVNIKVIKKTPLPPPPPPAETTKKWYKKKWPYIVAGVLLVGAGIAIAAGSSHAEGGSPGGGDAGFKF